MVELIGVRIWAVGFAAGEILPAHKLVCGTLARPWGAERPAWGHDLPPRIAVPGRPDVAVTWTGWFELAATGAVVGVYGAVVEAVGGGPPGAGASELDRAGL